MAHLGERLGIQLKDISEGIAKARGQIAGVRRELVRHRPSGESEPDEDDLDDGYYTDPR